MAFQKGKTYLNTGRTRFKKGFSPWNKGKKGVQKCTENTREKMASNNNCGWYKIGHSRAPSGKDCHLWKGGITPLHKKLRRCKKYIAWRNEVFTRDNYTCQECGQRGGKLNANHIILFSFIIQKEKIKTFDDAIKCNYLWNIDNGETLCENCHKLLRPNKMPCPKTLRLNIITKSS